MLAKHSDCSNKGEGVLNHTLERQEQQILLHLKQKESSKYTLNSKDTDLKPKD